MRCIVLHVTKYNDEQIIADLLTQSQGRVAMIVRISRSKRAAVRHSLFQPLALLDVQWDNRANAKLQRPRAAQNVFPFTSLPYDPGKSAMAFFLAEVLHHAVRQEPDTDLLFEYVERSMMWLDACERGFANFHLVFLLRLTRFLGFKPNTDGYETGKYFDLRTSCFTSQPPAHADVLQPADAALVPKLLRMRYDTMRFFRFSGNERARLLEYISLYYRLHLPGFPELNSLAVLKELFH